MSYLDDFRAEAAPEIKRLCRVYGLFLAQDARSYADAVDEVMQRAVALGAGYLEHNHIADLEQWVSAQILVGYDEFLPTVTAHRNLANRVAADLVRCGVVPW